MHGISIVMGYFMKTVLFALNSSYSHTNLAVRAIAAGMERHGLEYEIIEKNQKDKRGLILASLINAKADIYGFSSYIWNIEDMLDYASSLKKVLPSASIIFGGPEVLFRGDEFLSRNPFVSYIIRGEGEEVFPSLCEKIASGELCDRIIDAHKFAGFEQSGIYYGEYGELPHGLVYYESVRGCPFSCTYCLSSTDNKIRAKSAAQALKDLLGFERFDNIKTVKFVDRTFNFNVERAKELWRGLSSDKYTKEYHFEICASLLDEESVELLSNAPKGKFRVEIGLQSTNPKTLEAIRRKLDVKKTLEYTKRLYESGNLFVHLDLIAGLPFEDYASFARSFNDAYGICDELQLGFLKILCGCEMEKDAQRYGIVYSDKPPYKVLKTDFISFDKLEKLSLTDELCERFSNSGKFKNTFPWLPLAYGNAFEFFEKLGEFFEKRFDTRDISKISQAHAFTLILAFAQSFMDNADEVRARLALDFLLGETRRLPTEISDGVLAEGEMRETLLSVVPRARRADCEAAKLPFMSDKYIIVDRKNKILIRSEVPYDGV